MQWAVRIYTQQLVYMEGTHMKRKVGGRERMQNASSIPESMASCMGDAKGRAAEERELGLEKK